MAKLPCGATFSYFKLRKDFYFGFTKIGPYFMAQKEKAFIDACHLSAHGHYAFDLAALDMGRLDKAVLETMMVPFPVKLCSLLGVDQRPYYRQNNFRILKSYIER